jgi:uncharacterized membrane protein
MGLLTKSQVRACRTISAMQTHNFLVEFAKKLQSLARKGNAELMSVFTASFDGTVFNHDSFDVKFFLDNAKEVVNEHINNSSSGEPKS